MGNIEQSRKTKSSLIGKLFYFKYKLVDILQSGTALHHNVVARQSHDEHITVRATTPTKGRLGKAASSFPKGF